MHATIKQLTGEKTKEEQQKKSKKDHPGKLGANRLKGCNQTISGGGGGGAGLPRRKRRRPSKRWSKYVHSKVLMAHLHILLLVLLWILVLFKKRRVCIGVFVRICKYANAGSRVFEFMIDLHIYECVFVCVGGGVCG